MKISIGLLFTLLSFTLGAQRSMSLLEAQEYAMENSYLVKTSELEVDKAQKRLWEITAIGLPQVNGQLDYQYSPQLPQQPIPAEFFGGEPGTFQTVAFGVAHSSIASLQVSQLLFDGTYLLARQGSILLKEIRKDELEKSQIEVRDQVAQAYYNVKLSDEAEKVLEENLESLSRNLVEVRALYDAGFVEEQDADQLEYLVNGLSLDLENTRRSREVAEKFFKFTIGMSIDSSLTLTQSLEELYVQNTNGQTVIDQSFDVQNHIDYQLIDNQETGASLQLKRQKWEFAPKVNGFLNHSQSNFNDNNFNVFDYNSFWIPATVMGFSVNLPIFSSWQRPMRVQQAKIDLEEVRIAKEQTRESLGLEYEQALSDYKYATDRLKNEARNREITKDIRDKTLTKYREGVASSLEVTQTQNQYLNTERNFLSSVLNLLKAKSRLDKVLGNYNNP
jgi:outer membrane protein TolC